MKDVVALASAFRSGESEYFINKTQCRLKDVRDLFLDTGIGNDGYYIMAQGKIEFLLSAKPEERRELFEEAAGVSKYKVRREEALRKLAKVEQDMLRLNDSLAIYKQQMDSLEAAVRKARQHQKLQDELKRLEIASLLQGHQKAQADWEQIHLKQEEEAKHLADSARRGVGARENARRGPHGRRSPGRKRDRAPEADRPMRKRLGQGGSRTHRRPGARSGAEGRARSASGRKSAQIDKLVAGMAPDARRPSTPKSTSLRSQFHERNNAYKHEEEKGRHEQAELLNLQKALEQAKARLLELVRLISHHRNETVRLTSLSVRHEEASKAKSASWRKSALRRGALDEQIASQEKQAVETQENLTTIQNTLRAIDDLQRQDRTALAELERSIQNGRERLARLEAEKISLERWLSQDPVALAAGALRHASLPGIHGPVGRLLRTSGPYQRLLDRALGDRAHYFVADSLNDAQSAIRFLSDERKGWATFLVLDRLTQEEHLLPLSETMGSRSLGRSGGMRREIPPGPESPARPDVLRRRNAF